MDLQVSAYSSDRKVPLTQALAQLGLKLSDGYVLFGIDLPSIAEPEVYISIPDTTSLGGALAQVISQVPGYTFQAASEHVIDVDPIDIRSVNNDPLNLRIRHFAVTNEPAMNIFSRPSRFMPELKNYLLRGKTTNACGSLGPGIGSSGPGVTLNLEGNTVRQILNAVAEADAKLLEHSENHSVPVGWVHRMSVDPLKGLQDDWSFLSAVPHGWERFMKEKTKSE